MNLTKLTPAWQQLKALNGLPGISEAEILAAIEPRKHHPSKVRIQRVVQNIFAYSFLILMLNGGCSI
jgi:hypothetical protein